MKAVFLKELKLNRRSLFFWSLAIIITAAWGIGEYPFLKENLDAVMSGLNVLPRIILIMFGVDGLTLQTAMDYYLTMYYYYALIAFFHAVHTGYSIIAREEKNKTAEFLYTKPLSRHTVLSAKILSGITGLAVIAAVAFLTTLIGMLPVLQAFDITGKVLLTIVGMFFTQLVFFAFGALCAALFKTWKIISLSSYVLVITTYALAVYLRYVENSGLLNLLSPFQYFIAHNVIRSGLNPFYIIFSIGIALLAFYATSTLYTKREFLY